MYSDAGATLADNRSDVFSHSDAIVCVRSVSANSDFYESDVAMMRPEQILIGFLDPLTTPENFKAIATSGVISFAMELIPRISRAQSMDALTSMATISGYKSVLIAAQSLPKIFPMMITAAGTLTPAKVFVIGAGVAGLQAIATAKRLGAVVKSYDIRPIVKEQVESLGAKFVELTMDTNSTETTGGYAKAMDEDFYHRQRELMGEIVSESDVVISTAAVPGKKPPILVTENMVQDMQHGSVIVDLATDLGGNCELTKPGETTTVNGVTIIGATNLPSQVPNHASRLYSGNVVDFLIHLVKDGQISIDRQDEIVRETLITIDGQIFHQKITEILGLDLTSEDPERS